MNRTPGCDFKQRVKVNGTRQMTSEAMKRMTPAHECLNIWQHRKWHCGPVKISLTFTSLSNAVLPQPLGRNMEDIFKHSFQKSVALNCKHRNYKKIRVNFKGICQDTTMPSAPSGTCRALASSLWIILLHWEPGKGM